MDSKNLRLCQRLKPRAVTQNHINMFLAYNWTFKAHFNAKNMENSAFLGVKALQLVITPSDSKLAFIMKSPF